MASQVPASRLLNTANVTFEVARPCVLALLPVRKDVAAGRDLELKTEAHARHAALRWTVVLLRREHPGRQFRAHESPLHERTVKQHQVADVTWAPRPASRSADRSRCFAAMPRRPFVIDDEIPLLRRRRGRRDSFGRIPSRAYQLVGKRSRPRSHGTRCRLLDHQAEQHVRAIAVSAILAGREVRWLVRELRQEVDGRRNRMVRTIDEEGLVRLPRFFVGVADS
jgi:hypothetical protein